MKNKKKLMLKIIAGVVAILLIGFMLFVTNAFIGNPISAMMANKAVKQYVNQNYSYLDLEIEKAKYDFKNAGYMVQAISKTSIDTKFAIYYSKGKVQRDDYELFVLGMENTIQRFSNEYSVVSKNILAKELGYKDNTTVVMYDKEFKNINDILKLDMKFDKTLPINVEVTIQLDTVDSSFDGIAKIFTDAHKAFKGNDCNFSLYGLYAQNGDKSVMVYGVKPEDIESGKLVSLLEKAKNDVNANGIGIYIKE